MVETTIQASKPTILNHPLAPLKLFQQTFCKHCELQCSPTETRFQNCILCAILDLQAQQIKTKIERGW